MKEETLKPLLAKSLTEICGINGDEKDCEAIIKSFQKNIVLNVEKIALSEIKNWEFDRRSGDFFHISGKFFRYVGCKWNKKVFPIISQPEIGILGFLTAVFDDTLHFLVQLKKEPGNPNGVQLSPTVQATKSNYSQVHGGKLPRFLEFFLPGITKDIIFDQYQSEQGHRYYKKRNRNTILYTETPPDQGDSHIWMTLGQIKYFMNEPLLINSCARSVLSMLPINLKEKNRKEEYEYIDNQLFNSKLLDFKDDNYEPSSIIGLNSLSEWGLRKGFFSPIDKNNFSIIGVKISGKGREVKEWSQPLLKERNKGEYGLLIGKIKNVFHIFWKFRSEPGLIDGVEVGPSWIIRSEQDESGSLSYLRSKKAKEIVNIDFAEEGGRFHCSIFAHKVYNIGDIDLQDPILNELIPLTINQTEKYMSSSGLFTIESRSLWSILKEEYFD